MWFKKEGKGIDRVNTCTIATESNTKTRAHEIPKMRVKERIKPRRVNIKKMSL